MLLVRQRDSRQKKTGECMYPPVVSMMSHCARRDDPSITVVTCQRARRGGIRMRGVGAYRHTPHEQCSTRRDAPNAGRLLLVVYRIRLKWSGDWLPCAPHPPAPSPTLRGGKGSRPAVFSPFPPRGGRAGDGGPSLCDEFQPTRIHCPRRRRHSAERQASGYFALVDFLRRGLAVFFFSSSASADSSVTSSAAVPFGRLAFTLPCLTKGP